MSLCVIKNVGLCYVNVATESRTEGVNQKQLLIHIRKVYMKLPKFQQSCFILEQ